MSDLNFNIKKINSSLEKLEQSYLNISKLIENKDINNSINTALNLLNNMKEDLIKLNDIGKSAINTFINNKDEEIANGIKKLLLK